MHTRTYRERTGMSKLSEICYRSLLQGKSSSRRGRLGLESGTVRNRPSVGCYLLINEPLRSNVLHLSREERPKVDSRQNSSNDKTPRRFRTPVQNGRKRRHIEVSEGSDSDVVCLAGPSNPNESSEIADSSPLQAKSTRKASRRQTSKEPSSDPGEEELQRECVRASRLPVSSSLVVIQPIH